jgi:hypothetical protein
MSILMRWLGSAAALERSRALRCWLDGAYDKAQQETGKITTLENGFRNENGGRRHIETRAARNREDGHHNRHDDNDRQERLPTEHQTYSDSEQCQPSRKIRHLGALDRKLIGRDMLQFVSAGERQGSGKAKPLRA